jgi:hypothetical protein
MLGELFERELYTAAAEFLLRFHLPTAAREMMFRDRY